MNEKLNAAWLERNKLYAEGNKIYAEGYKFYAESYKLRAEGKLLWANAILEVHGNIAIEWRWNDEKQDLDCILGTGEEFFA